MKKIITLALACIMAFALTACSGNGDTDKVPENLDLATVYQGILDAQGENKDSLVLLEEPETSGYMAELYAGLTDIPRKQTVFYMAPVSGFATEVLLVEVENKEDIEAVKEIFQKRIDIPRTTRSMWRLRLNGRELRYSLREITWE